MIVTILIFVAVIAVIILIHEFGHFITARMFGVSVEEVGIGFPPRLTGFQTKKRFYSINAIPAGGFVKLKGEQGDHANDTDSFSHKKPWKRSIILIAGVTMNVVLAIVILSVGYMIGLPKAIETDLGKHATVSNQHIQIVDVQKDSPAEAAGLQAGDIITSLNGSHPTQTEDIKSITQSNLDTELRITYTREEREFTTGVIPKILNAVPDRPTIGIVTVAAGDVSYPFFVAIWMGIKEAFYFLWMIISALWGMLVNLFTNQPSEGGLVGPIGVAVITSKFAHLGFVYLLQFVALISLNLAIVNILPIPALDGGRLLFLLVEKIKGKPIKQKTEALIHNVGFIVILLLLGFITIRDVFQLDKINNLF